MAALIFDVEHTYPKSSLGIEVQVTFKPSGMRISAKVDTGSEYCIFDREIADALGIEVETGHRIGIASVTGAFSAYGHSVQFSTLGYDFDAVVFFADIRRNVLGRRGWLDRIKFGLIEHDSLLYISGYDK